MIKTLKLFYKESLIKNIKKSKIIEIKFVDKSSTEIQFLVAKGKLYYIENDKKYQVLNIQQSVLKFAKRYNYLQINEIKINGEIFYDFEHGQEGKLYLQCIQKQRYNIEIDEKCKELINDNYIKYKKMPSVTIEQKYYVDLYIEPYIFYNFKEEEKKNIIKYYFFANNITTCLYSNFITIGNEKIYESKKIYDFCIGEDELFVYITIPNYLIVYNRENKKIFQVETKISEISSVQCCKDYLGVMDPQNKIIQVYSIKNNYNFYREISYRDYNCVDMKNYEKFEIFQDDEYVVLVTTGICLDVTFFNKKEFIYCSGNRQNIKNSIYTNYNSYTKRMIILHYNYDNNYFLISIYNLENKRFIDRSKYKKCFIFDVKFCKFSKDGKYLFVAQHEGEKIIYNFEHLDNWYVQRNNADTTTVIREYKLNAQLVQIDRHKNVIDISKQIDEYYDYVTYFYDVHFSLDNKNLLMVNDGKIYVMEIPYFKDRKTVDKNTQININIKPYLAKQRTVGGDNSVTNFVNNTLYDENLKKLIFEYI